MTGLFTLSGIALSYGPDLPAGATIIVLAGCIYLGVATGKTLLEKRG
jgi:zinc transport system permease protein